MQKGYNISNAEKENFKEQAYAYARTVTYDKVKENPLPFTVENWDYVVTEIIDLVPYESTGLSLNDFSNFIKDATENPKIKHFVIISGAFQILKPIEIGGHKEWVNIFNFISNGINELAKIIDAGIEKEIEEIYKANPQMKQGSIFSNVTPIITA